MLLINFLLKDKRMKKIVDAYKINKGKNSLFAKELIVDYYDGALEAICQIKNEDIWVIASMVYFNPDEQIRIFTIIKIAERHLQNMQKLLERYQIMGNAEYEPIKQEIKRYYETYSGDVLLFKSDLLSSVNYEIVSMPKKLLRYFPRVESVLDQSLVEQSQWMNLFSNN